jgi:hypothetical protein
MSIQNKVRFFSACAVLLFVFTGCKDLLHPEGPSKQDTGDKEYTVTVGPLENGSILAWPPQAPGGTTVALFINPDSGFRLKPNTLKYNDGTDHVISGINFVLPAANITVSAEFETVSELNTYTVSMGTLINGNITAKPQYGLTGTTITLTIQPNSGYRLKADTLKYNDGTDHAISGNSFPLPAANVTVSAEFVPVPSTNYTVSIAPLINGNITAEPQYGLEGTVIALAIQPNTDYRLKAGTLKYNDGTDHAISGTSFILPAANVTVSAEFETNYTVSIGALINGNITAEPQNGPAGTTITLTIQPNSSFRLKANTLKYNDGADHTISGNSFILPAANVTVSAEFEAVINAESYNVGSAAELTSVLTSIRNSGKTDFDIMVTADFSSAPVALTDAAYKNKTITLKGSGAERTISLSGNGSLFTVGQDVTLVLDSNITLQGRSGNNTALVTVDGGDLVMNYGSKVTGNDVFSSVTLIAGSGVDIINNGSFIMNDGEISGNSFTTSRHDNNGGGVTLGNGTFTMDGGKITGNSASSAHSCGVAGGVLISSGTFTLNNGEITNNTASGTWFQCGHGGGIVINSGFFIMNGGEIKNNTANSASSSSGGAGGGVMVGGGGTFSMYGGVISHNSASHPHAGGGVFVISPELASMLFKKESTGGTIYGSNASAELMNTANGAGNAVRGTEWFGAYTKARNTTVNPGETLNSSISGSAGGWE